MILFEKIGKFHCYIVFHSMRLWCRCRLIFSCGSGTCDIECHVFHWIKRVVVFSWYIFQWCDYTSGQVDPSLTTGWESSNVWNYRFHNTAHAWSYVLFYYGFNLVLNCQACCWNVRKWSSAFVGKLDVCKPILKRIGNFPAFNIKSRIKPWFTFFWSWTSVIQKSLACQRDGLPLVVFWKCDLNLNAFLFRRWSSCGFVVVWHSEKAHVAWLVTFPNNKIASGPLLMYSL